MYAFYYSLYFSILFHRYRWYSRYFLKVLGVCSCFFACYFNCALVAYFESYIYFHIQLWRLWMPLTSKVLNFNHILCNSSFLSFFFLPAENLKIKVRKNTLNPTALYKYRYWCFIWRQTTFDMWIGNRLVRRNCEVREKTNKLQQLDVYF